MLASLMAFYGNPSSAHSVGRQAKKGLVLARERVADLIKGCPSHLIFTSGGTEANSQILLSAAAISTKPVSIITSKVEHSSVLKTCEYLEQGGAKVSCLSVDSNGHVSLDELREVISESTTLVSIQWVNNETGAIQDIQSIGSICHALGVPFHSDAAQAVGKMDVSAEEIPVDYLTFTAHKLHGPKGVGAIYNKSLDGLRPLFHGGSQESGLRPGTENTTGIIGFGKAAEIRASTLTGVLKHLKHCRELFEGLVCGLGSDIFINASGEDRICNTSSIQFRGVEGFALIAQLDNLGVQCSQSSACTNQRPEPSYVLRAMGLSEDDAYSSVRFCFSQLNTTQEMRTAVEAIKQVLARLK